jgi:hypothetical protein
VRARALKYAALQAGKVGHTTPSTPLSWPGITLHAPPLSRAPCSPVLRRRFPAPHFSPA